MTNRRSNNFLTYGNLLLLVVGFLVVLNSKTAAQHASSSFTSTLFTEAKLHQGFIIPHHQEMWRLTDGFFPSYEFSIIRQTVGKNSSMYLRNNPRLGISYRYTGFGDSRYLGVAHSVMPFINLELLRTSKMLLDFRVALGVGYLTNKYHRTNNFKNRAISSHLNASVNFQLQAKWPLSKATDFTAGLSMLHLSNGTTKTPNYGLNIPGVFAGFYFKMNKAPINFLQPDTLIFHKGKTNFRLFAATGLKEVIDHWEEKFRVYTGEMAVTHYYSNINRLLVGFDFTWDESSIPALESQGDTTRNTKELSKIGVVAGHEWVFSRLTMTFSLGYYLHNKSRTDKSLYNKIGLSYYLTRNIYTGITLKSHYAKADFLVIGAGLNF
jgi:hypothetical protein